MITVRKAEEKDKQVFIKMEKEFYRFYDAHGFDNHLKPLPHEDIPESFYAHTFDDLLSANGLFCVAEKDGCVVGYIEAEIVKPYEKELHAITKTGHVNSLFIFEEYRKTGIAKRLLDEATKWMKPQGVELCTLSVVQGNTSALAAYEKLGFGTERIRMWKKI